MLSAAPALRGTQPDTTAAVSPQQDLANNASTQQSNSVFFCDGALQASNLAVIRSHSCNMCTSSSY